MTELAKTEPLALPPLYYPFPEEINEHAAAVTEHSLDWFEAQGLAGGPVVYERFRDSKIGWLAARVNPYAAFEELAIASDWYMWLLAVDDHCDESDIGRHPGELAQLMPRLIRVLEHPDAANASHAGSMGEALRDLLLRMAAKASPAWMARLVRSVETLFFGLVWESTNRLRGIVPTVEDYVMMRPRPGGMHSVNDLIELAGRFELPADVLHRPEVQTLVTRSNNVVCWSNDIEGVAKEAKHGDVHNLVIVLENQHGCSLEEAFEMATRMHDTEVRSFLALEEEVMSARPVHGDLGRYIAGLRHWMQGNWYWTLSNARYDAGY